MLTSGERFKTVGTNVNILTFAKGIDLAEPALIHRGGRLVNLVPEHDHLRDVGVEEGLLVGQEDFVHHAEDQVLHAGRLGLGQGRLEQVRTLVQHTCNNQCCASKCFDFGS